MLLRSATQLRVKPIREETEWSAALSNVEHIIFFFQSQNDRL